MKRTKTRKRILSIVLMLLFGISTWFGIPRVVAATASYSGFSAEDALSIYLIGSDAQYDTQSYSVDAILALYQINSPDYKVVAKNYEISAKEGQVYSENEAALSSQLQEYLDLKGQTELAHDADLVAYYQNLYDQTLTQKATVTYQKDMNQFIIDHLVMLRQNDEKKAEAGFAKQVYALIGLQYRLSYYNKLLEYQQTTVAAQKVKLHKEKILPSEYDVALAEAVKTTADISAIQMSIQNTTNYIRVQTGIAKSQDIIMEYDIKKIKDLSIIAFSTAVDINWINNLDEERLSQEIMAKTSQRNALLPLYDVNSNQSQLYLLGIEKLELDLISLTLQLEQQKLEQKNQFASLKTSYDGAVSRAKELSNIAYEKSTLYDLGMGTKLERIKSEIDREQAIYELYNIIQQLLGASFD